MLQLFENESQKLVKAAKEKREKDIEDIEKRAKEVDEIMMEINAPFSHTSPVKSPPPYESEVKIKDIYPQLPVISQEGRYCIKDDNDQIIEVGQAETTIKMIQSSKSKKKMRHLDSIKDQKDGSR